MKSAIGEGMTRKDHSDVSNQLYACYAIGKILPISVVVPHRLDADPDSTSYPDADPDPDFYLIRMQSRIRLFILMRIRIQILASK